MQIPLVLASSSPYRKELLRRLQLPFVTANPNIDERALTNETPTALVERLALTKAQALKSEFPHHFIIGSDQVAVFNQQILGKPYTVERAVQQLLSFSNARVVFYTGLSLYNSRNHQHLTTNVPFEVHFRSLTEAEVRAYVAKEQPLQCAGSFKSEALGSTLFQRMQGDDPSSLVGLPLIQLTNFLRQWGINPLLT